MVRAGLNMKSSPLVEVSEAEVAVREQGHEIELGGHTSSCLEHTCGCLEVDGADDVDNRCEPTSVSLGTSFLASPHSLQRFRHRCQRFFQLACQQKRLGVRYKRERSGN